MSDDNLRRLLIKHEGIRLKPYLDTVGKSTIGVGRNLTDIGVNELEAMMMLSNDIFRIKREAVDNFAWFKSLDLVRQDVVLSMLFNMGLDHFKTFTKFIDALRIQNYERAASEMLASVWASQVKYRAVELAQMMRSGSYPI
jgi:lysozyme